MDNFIIRGLLKELVTDEMIDSAVINRVSERFNYSINEQIRKTALDLAGEAVEKLVREKVDDFFAKPVKTDNGWGEVEYHDSFEAFMKNTIKTKLSSSWEIERMVKRYVDDKIGNLCKKIASEVAEVQVNDAIKMLKESQT